MNLNINKVKIIVTVPTDKIDIVRNALCDAGAGIIGNYSFCTTSTKVIGTFIPNNQANPYIGKPRKLEYVNEEKLEVVCNIDEVKTVITKLKQVHQVSKKHYL